VNNTKQLQHNGMQQSFIRIRSFKEKRYVLKAAEYAEKLGNRVADSEFTVVGFSVHYQ
jgi:hypothetical protein